MRLIKDPNKLRKPLETKPMTQEQIDEISTTLLTELKKTWWYWIISKPNWFRCSCLCNQCKRTFGINKSKSY
jgi:hypothetical protein